MMPTNEYVEVRNGGYFVADGAERITRSFLVSETGAQLLPWPAFAGSRDGPLDCAACDCTEEGFCEAATARVKQKSSQLAALRRNRRKMSHPVTNISSISKPLAG